MIYEWKALNKNLIRFDHLGEGLNFTVEDGLKLTLAFKASPLPEIHFEKFGYAGLGPSFNEWKYDTLLSMHDKFVEDGYHLHVIYRTLPESLPCHQHDTGEPKLGDLHFFDAALLITKEKQLLGLQLV